MNDDGTFTGHQVSSILTCGLYKYYKWQNHTKDEGNSEIWYW